MRHGAKGGSPCPVVPPGERGVPLRRMSGSSGSGEDPPMTDLPPAVVTAMRLIRRLGVEFVRRYHRLEVLPQIEPFPDEPVLIVANHGFGGIVDLNVFALLATFDALRLDRPVTLLTHQLAWTLQVGRFLEPLGARPASRHAGWEALAAGRHVLVLPGGEVDGSKSWRDRNTIVFAGRMGFAALAMEAGVPILPIVTAGAGESLLVLTAGQGLARLTRTDRLLRLKALPVSVSLPWGLNIGAVGLLPYLPLPTKLVTAVLPAMRPAPGESADQLARRVQEVMQARLTALTAGRRPLLG